MLGLGHMLGKRENMGAGGQLGLSPFVLIALVLYLVLLSRVTINSVRSCLVTSLQAHECDQV